jgi:phosphoglycerol transferase MdoB-like AlkP superfamily enzyme
MDEKGHLDVGENQDGWFHRLRPGAVYWGLISFVVAFCLKYLYIGWVLQDEWWHEPLGPLHSPPPSWFLAGGMLGCILLFAAFSLLLPRAWHYVALGVMYLFFSLLAVGDVIHVRYFQRLIPAGRVHQVSMLGDLVISTTSSWTWSYVAYCLDAVLFIPFLFVVASWAAKFGATPRANPKGFALLAVIGAVLVTPTVSATMSDPNRNVAYLGMQAQIAASMGPLPYHLVDLVSKVAVPAEKPKVTPEMTAWFRQHNADLAPKSPLFGRMAGMNVIQISAESLQAFPIGLKIAGQKVTPNLDQLTAESLFFENFTDQAHLGTTSDTEFMTNQSLYPLPEEWVVDDYNTNHWRGSAAILKDRGYTTFSACGSASGFWHMNLMHPSFGFERSYFEEAFKATEQMPGWTWIPDHDFLPQAVDLMKAQNQPFYAYLLTSTNHYPYEVPDKDKSLNFGSISDPLLQRYLHSVHLFDQAVGKFVAKLKEDGLWDSTILVIYGDHQAFMDDTPDLAKLKNFAPSDAFAFWRTRKQIPLWIHLPHGEAAGVRKNFASQLDIAPTILSLLGVEDKSAVMMGQDITAGRDSLVVFRDGSFIDGQHYFINNFGPISQSHCFSTRTLQPENCAPLAARRAEAQERLALSDRIVHGDLVPELWNSLKRNSPEPN